jgi:hypothetical protein
LQLSRRRKVRGLLLHDWLFADAGQVFGSIEAGAMVGEVAKWALLESGRSDTLWHEKCEKCDDWRGGIASEDEVRCPNQCKEAFNSFDMNRLVHP